MIIVLCAWCGAQYDAKANPGHDGFSISHGICASCAAKVMAENRLHEVETDRRAA
jgi:hypothetical protein